MADYILRCIDCGEQFSLPDAYKHTDNCPYGTPYGFVTRFSVEEKGAQNG